MGVAGSHPKFVYVAVVDPAQRGVAGLLLALPNPPQRAHAASATAAAPMIGEGMRIETLNFAWKT